MWLVEEKPAKRQLSKWSSFQTVEIKSFRHFILKQTLPRGAKRHDWIQRQKTGHIQITPATTTNGKKKDAGSVNNGAHDYDPSTSPKHMHFEIKSKSHFYQHMRILDPNYLPYKHWVANMPSSNDKFSLYVWRHSIRIHHVHLHHINWVITCGDIGWTSRQTILRIPFCLLRKLRVKEDFWV